MRYDKGRKAETRQHIIDVAGRQFREDGIAASGISGLMAEAGLTNGAFYAHFDSKEHLVQDALTQIRVVQVERLRTLLDGDDGLHAWIRRYLSAAHRDNPGGGCPAAALAGELGRHPHETREAFTLALQDMIELLAGRLPIKGPSAQRQTAIAIYGMLIGTLQMARAASDPALSDEILASGLKQALAIVPTS